MQQTDEEKGWSTNTMVVEPQTNVIVTTSTQKQTNAVPQNEDLTGWEEEPQPPQTHDDDWASQTENWSDIYKPQNDGNFFFFFFLTFSYESQLNYCSLRFNKMNFCRFYNSWRQWTR